MADRFRGRSHAKSITTFQSSLRKGVDGLLGRGNAPLGQLPSDGLPRLPFTPRLKDEIEVRLQFALKRFAAVHTHSWQCQPFAQIYGCLQMSTLRASVNLCEC